jgi:hypothetical protein
VLRSSFEDVVKEEEEEHVGIGIPLVIYEGFVALRTKIWHFAYTPSDRASNKRLESSYLRQANSRRKFFHGNI